MGFAALCPSYDFGDVAQLVEHLLCKQGVVGSIPSISTRNLARILGGVGGCIYREIRVSIHRKPVPEKVGFLRVGCLFPSLIVGGAKLFF